MKCPHSSLQSSFGALLPLLFAGNANAEVPSISSLIFDAPNIVGIVADDETEATPLEAEGDTTPPSPWTSTIGAGLSYSQTDDVTLGANFNGSFARRHFPDSKEGGSRPILHFHND